MKGVRKASRIALAPIVLAARDRDDHTHALVVPVTHTSPVNLADALEVPAAIKQHPGLDTERSWIVPNESNPSEWPDLICAASATATMVR